MIEVQNLIKHFGPTRAVDGISFRVDQGDVVGFLGPNGAGKTTTLRVLACFHPASAGKAEVAGHDVRKAPLDVRRNVGYLPENVPIYGDMRVREYLTYRAALKGVSRKQRRSHVDVAMERCEVTDVQRKLVRNVSRGYRQRVGLADALVANPPILILDEPTSGLDPNQRRRVKAMVRELAREHTILFSSHILAEVEDVSNRILVIHRGRIQADGEPHQLLEAGVGRTLLVTAKAPVDVLRSRLEEVSALLSVQVEEPAMDGFATASAPIAGTADPRDAVWATLRAADVPIRELRVELPTLERLFYDLTEGADLRAAGEAVSSDPGPKRSPAMAVGGAAGPRDPGARL